MKRNAILFFLNTEANRTGIGDKEKREKLKKFTKYCLLRGVSRDAEYNDVINKAHNSVSHMSILL